ncbi:MAG: hypothetical protein LBG83_06510 [Oscillospiraceae bacterium]|nr:hypothetical protein [Oscillospiraceae bacterium]
MSKQSANVNPSVPKLDSHAFARKHPELWKFVKWAMSGFIANVPELGTQLLCLWGLTALGVAYLPNFFIFNFLAEHGLQNANYTPAVLVYAYMISTAVGYAIAFVLNRKATFHADSNVALSTFLYVIMVVFTIFANGIIGPAITALVGRLPVGDGLVQILSKILCMAVPGLWTYPCSRFIIHRKKKEVPPNA